MWLMWREKNFCIHCPDAGNGRQGKDVSMAVVAFDTLLCVCICKRYHGGSYVDVINLEPGHGRTPARSLDPDLMVRVVGRIELIWWSVDDRVQHLA